MGNNQLNVSVSVAGVPVRVYTPGAMPCIYIAHGGTIQANQTNADAVTIGNSAVTGPSVTPSAWMWLLNPGDSVALPGDCSVDLTTLYLNGSSPGDGVSLGWFN
jgi:hypothetical protein